MKKNRLLFRVIILLILCGAVGFTLYQGFFANKEKMQIGKEAPNFIVTDLEGKKIELKDLKGKGVFLNFWGTWCKPCEKEMPYVVLTDDVQLCHDRLQCADDLFIIHPFRSDDPDLSLQAVRQFICSGDDAAVFHALHRGFITDVDPDAVRQIRALIAFRQKLRHLVFIFKRPDDLPGAVCVRQLRITEDVRGAAGIDLHFIVPAERFAQRLHDFCDHPAVRTGFIVHAVHVRQADLVQRLSCQSFIQQQVQGEQVFIREHIVRVKERIPDNVPFHHCNQQQLKVIDPRQLQKLQLIPVHPGGRNHSCIVRVRRDDLNQLFQQEFHAVDPLQQEVLRSQLVFLRLRDQLQLFLAHQLLYIHAVSQIRGNTARRSVRALSASS